MRFPRDSGRRATSSAAQTAAPQLMPARMPSRRARRCAVAIASSSEQASTSSSRSRSRTSGTKPAPMPWMRCGPGGAAREDGGARGLDRDDAGRRVVRLEHVADARDGPAGPDAGDEDVDAAVEVVQQLGGGATAVGLGVGRVRELVGQEGVVARGHTTGGIDGLVHARRATRRPRRGRRRAAAGPLAPGSSPAGGRSPGRSPWRRSRTPARCRCCPEVASTIVVRPGSMRPSRSAASIIATPMRSFTEPPGLKDSSLAYSSTSTPSGTIRVRRTIGVRPT